MPYSPQPPASIQNVEELRQWIQDELRNVSLAINETQILDLRPSFRAPDRLREGVMVYADGVQFNPGSGEGPYVWDGGAWKYMIAPSPTDLSAITSAIAANTADITELEATSPPGLVFIQSQVASNSSQLVFTGINGALYEAYEFHITRLKPSVAAAQIWMQMSLNGGATWKNTSNLWSWVYAYSQGGATPYGHTNVAEGSSAYFRITGASTTTWGSNAEVTVYPSASGQNLNCAKWSSIEWYTTLGSYTINGGGVETSDATTCNAVRFLFNTGNIVSGRISMYGLRRT